MKETWFVVGIREGEAKVMDAFPTKREAITCAGVEALQFEFEGVELGVMSSREVERAVKGNQIKQKEVS